jgi:hypothetical protein
MPASASPRVLVVANRTASTPALLAEVERRGKAGASFTLLIPPETDRHVSDWTREDAERLVGRACGSTVECIDAGENAADTIHRAVAGGDCDQVIVSTTPEHHKLWFHHDLPARLQNLGVPVTVIPPEPDNPAPIAGFPNDWQPHVVNPAGIAGLGNY